jgi:hypothetical protein
MNTAGGIATWESGATPRVTVQVVAGVGSQGPVEQVAEHGKGVVAVLAGGGDVGAQPAERLGAGHGPPAAGDLAGVTAHPDGAWVTQQARNLLMPATGPCPRFLLRDRDAKFTRAFDSVFRSEGTEVLITPVPAPNANAYAERWIRTVRDECLDWLLVVGRGHLEQVLRVYIEHDNAHRPHRALGLQPPDPAVGPALSSKDQPAQVHRPDLLGGLMHEYRRAA